MLSVLGLDVKKRASLEAMSSSLIHSSLIEGEILSADSVRSSLAVRLGVTFPQPKIPDHYVEGIVQANVDAMQNYSQPLTTERLFGWHAAMFPTGYSGSQKIMVADWRKGESPMLVVSGAVGHEKIHYEAPPSDIVPKEMERYLDWVDNASTDSLLKAAIAHLWFVAIHPFDDGNGRLARIVTDMLMCRADGEPQRYYSVTTEILKHRKEYYDTLNKTTCGELDITQWITWFLHRVNDAITNTEKTLSSVMEKHRFWNETQYVDINERQRKVLNRLMSDFEGNLTSSKWAKIAHCSTDTALRDIQDLIAKGILNKSGEGGRSTHYIITWSKTQIAPDSDSIDATKKDYFE